MPMPSCKIRRLVHKLTISVIAVGLVNGDAKLMGCETCQVAIVGMSHIVKKEMLLPDACLDSSVHTLIPFERLSFERLPSARRSGRSCHSINRVEK